jgi:hypothetical protein
MKRINIFAVAALWLVLAVMPRAAFAGPPFKTDDPEPVEYKQWELYLGSQYCIEGKEYTLFRKTNILRHYPHLLIFLSEQRSLV